MSKPASPSVSGCKDSLDEDKALRAMFREDGCRRAKGLFKDSMKFNKKMLKKAARRAAKVIEE